MESEVQQIIDERRRTGNVDEHKDLLSAMLTGIDKKTGQKLSDDNIVAQCQTFLIAGHETTSGLLSFAISFLIKHPDVVARAQEEVDRVLGTDTSLLPTYQQVQGLTYVNQILNETLRLWPTVAAFTRYPYHDATVGPYLMPKGSSITALTIMLHRDPSRVGRRRRGLQPRPLPPRNPITDPAERVQAVRLRSTGLHRPPIRHPRSHAGPRHAAATLRLHRLPELSAQGQRGSDHQTRRLVHQDQTAPRPHHRNRTHHHHHRRRPTGKPLSRKARPQRTGEGHNTPLMVLFGSNLGTAEGIASRIAQDGSDRGYAVTLGALDDHTGELPHEGALVVVCASYNGKPPDNAERFCRWITDPATPSDAGSGLAFSVFGCGNMDWASTYQAVPTLIDTQLEAHGAHRMHARGEGDARSDFDGQFSEWYQELWSSLADGLGLGAESTTASTTEPRLQLTMENKQTTNPVVMSYRANPSTLVVNRELLKNGQSASDDSRSARHIELELPAGMEYQTGDHLGVLPRNNIDLIRRVMARFGLDAGTYVTINPTGGGTYTHLPLGEAAPLLGILGACVELQDVASRSDLGGARPVRERSCRRRKSCRPCPGWTRPDGRLTANRSQPVGCRCSNCLTTSPASTFRSTSTWSCCHRCGRATTPSPPPPPLRQHLPPDGRGAAWARSQRRRVLQRGGLQPSGEQHGEQHAVHLCSQADHSVPSTGQPTHTDDHGRGGHRHGTLPWFPAGACRAGRAGRTRWEVSPLLSAAVTLSTTCSMPMS